MADEAPMPRRLNRRRRQNAKGGRQHSHQVKVTPEEEAILTRLAAQQRVSIPRLLVESALSVEERETPTQRRDALAELFKLYRLLSQISNNVNQIARVTNATGDQQPETTAALDAVRRAAQRIDEAIDGLAR